MSKEVVSTIYHYDRESGELQGSNQARLDPLEKKPLIPAQATLFQPPQTGNNEVAVFDENKEEWSIKKDHRGEVFFDEKGDKIEIDSIGQIPEKTWTKNQPQSQPLSDNEIIKGIKREAAARIIDSGYDWMAARQISTDKTVPQSIIDYAQSVRLASDALEKTLPQDFTDDKHWPARI